MATHDAAIVDTMRFRGLAHDPRIGPAGERNAGQGVRHTEDIFEGARHRTRACATGERKRTVDIKEEESVARAGQPSLRTLPARGPLADGSSSKLTR